MTASRPSTSAIPPKPPRRLGVPALAGVVLVINLLFFGLGAYALVQSRAQYEQRAQQLTQNLAGAIDRSVSANVEMIDMALHTVVDDLEAQLGAGALDLASADTRLRAQIRNHGMLDGIRVTDTRGRAILGPGLDMRQPVDFSDREWFMAQRDQPARGLFVSRPIASRINGEWILSFSRRYQSRSGAFAGAVTAAVPLAHFTKLLATIDVGAKGVVLLRDGQLGLIARLPVPSKPSPGTTIGNRAVSPELLQLVQAGLAQSTFHAKRTADGIERTTTFRRLNFASMIVVVGVASEEYLAGWYNEFATMLSFCGGFALLSALGSFFLLRAIGQHQRALRRIDLLAKVFEHSGEAILITDHANRIVEVNPAFVARTGYAPQEVIGLNPRLLTAGRTSADEYRAMWQRIHSSGVWRGELWDRSKDGTVYPKWMSISLLRDTAGRITHHIGSFVDMSEVKLAEEKILHLAHHDTLTQLPNRVHLQGRLEQALAGAQRTGASLAMLFIDMDRFKNINDTLGHHVGDALLVEVARRLQGLVRESDIVARLGGDEFVVVLTGLSSEAVQAAAAVAGKVLEALGHPYKVSGHELHSTPSMGISIFPDDGRDGDTLMRNADTAMYQAKAGGRNTYRFFTASMNDVAQERLLLEDGLRTAVERGELLLHFQPQVHVASGRVLAVEALLRWAHPDLGLIAPLKFIPVAEETGLIGPIGEWVLDQALAQLARWHGAGLAGLRMAVNLSAHQLRGDSFVGVVAAALARHGVDGSALELEITESAAMSDPARTALLLKQLRAQGVALAIDDFGTGYSSLAYLKQLPLSCLKLDRSFVMDIEHDANDATISAATITLAHSLGLAVVAEGVETAAQFEFLRRFGCDLVQGYHFSRPLPAAEAEAFVRRSWSRGGRGIEASAPRTKPLALLAGD